MTMTEWLYSYTNYQPAHVTHALWSESASIPQSVPSSVASPRHGHVLCCRKIGLSQ